MKTQAQWLTISLILIFSISVMPAVFSQTVAKDGKTDQAKKKVVAAASSTAKISTDRASALYTCKDKAVFTVTLLSGNDLVTEGTCRIKLTYDGAGTGTEKEYDLSKENPFKIEVSQEVPGFVKCDFMGVDKFKDVRTRATAGFDVEKIRQGQAEPPDFEQYWAQLLKRQASITDAVTCEPLPDSAGKPGYKYFKLTIKTIDDGKVYGFLGVPSGNPGPFAALALIAGAGSGYDSPDPTFIRPDMMTLSINIHPIDPSLPQAEFQKRYKELTSAKDYWLQGAPDRDKYYFRNAILGANAAVDWLAAHPQFNKKDLFYLGASQGGGFGLILAGLNPKFTSIAVSASALCDHGGIAVGRVSGWPQLVKNVAKDDEALRKQTLEMSGYFDAVNFAKRVKCPAIFTVGFNDVTCCPSSVYAAYNAVKSTKFIMTAPLADHPIPWWHLNGIWQWIQNGLDEKDRAYRTYFDW
jgi:cephalosporin-C deacetylase-like acetyl esterase